MSDHNNEGNAGASAVASPTQPARVEAVLFDYGQVLSQGPNQDAWERLRTISGADEARFHQAYWAFRHEYDRGTLNGHTYWHAVAQAAGHPGLSEAELEALCAADVDLWTDLNEPMLQWAQSLQRRGVRTGILSNIGDRMEHGIRERFAWLSAFDHCTWSHRLLLAKPEPEIYLRAAEGLGVRPERVLFIDDREENIAGARAAAMQAIHFTTYPAFLEQLRGQGYQELLPKQ